MAERIHGSGEMAGRIRAFDWSATPLGPIERWPRSLTTAVDLMLASAQPAYIAWGVELISFYNDGYISIAGDKHPNSLGLPYRLMWPELWREFRGVSDAVLQGDAQHFVDRPVALKGRPDRPMSWFTFSWTPLRDDEGEIAGFYCAAVETTDRILAERTVERNYRSLFEAMDEGYLLADVIFDGTGVARDIAFVDINPAATRIIGIDFKGRRLREINPDYEHYWYDIFGRVARSGVSERLERHAAPSGRWYDFYIFKPDPDNATSDRVAVLFHDITGRKLDDMTRREEEKRQEFLLELSDLLRPVTDSLQIQQAAMKLLAERYDVNRAGYLDVHADGDTMTMAAHFERDAVPVPNPIRLSDYGPDLVEAFHAGHTRSVRDTEAETDSEEQRAAYRAIGVRAWIIAPIVKAGRLIAIVGVISRTARDWASAEVQLVTDLAERTWDAVQRANAEAALRDSEARYRLLFETIDEGFSLCERVPGEPIDFRYILVNPAFDRQSGLDHPVGKTIREIVPGVEEETMQAYARVEETGVPEHFSTCVADLGQWFDVETIPTGQPGRIAMLFRNVTERKRAEAALQASENRLQTLIEGVPQLVWRAVGGGHWTWASPQWTDFTGQPETDSHGQGWLDPVHPDDRERVMAVWRGAIGRGEFHADYRLCHASEGRYAWFQTRATPVRDRAGTIVEWLGTSTDVDDLRRLQNRQQIMVQELQHRTRNLITVVGALSAQTMKGATSLDDFDQSFGDRLAALSRVQGLLSHLTAGRRVSFDQLLRTELDALGAADDQVTLDGPADVPLPSAMVQTFALALHELATNSLKYGALSGANGHLTVRWSARPSGDGTRLCVDWRESGVALTQVEDRQRGGGYGRELIERALPYQMGAATTYEMAADGVHCTIEVPVSTERGTAEQYGEHRVA